MLTDANSDEIRSIDSHFFDVCVIGAGVFGITLAATLAERGLRVVLLEGGGFEYSEDSQSLYEDDGGSTGVVDGATKDGRLRYFGGTSGHWAGHSVELETYDFIPKSYVAYSGWPIGKNDLSPYVERAKEWLEAKGLLGANYPFDELHQLEFKSIKKPVSQSVDSELPTRFGERYRDRIVNNDAINLIIHANAVGLILNDGLDAIKAVEVTSLDGKRRTVVRAKSYVLCLGGLETPRFLLNCNQKFFEE